MAGRKKKPGEFRPLAVKVPVGHYAVLAGVAEARGIDLSALVNSLLAERMAELAEWLRLYHAEKPGGRLASLAALGRADAEALALIADGLRAAGARPGDGTADGELLAEAMEAQRMTGREG